MKKLLTVLLAAAIVLTYSVPAVFADTTSDIATGTAYAQNMITAIANSTKAEASASGLYESTAIDQATTDATRIANQLANDLVTLNTNASTGAFDLAAFKADVDEWCGVSGAAGVHVGSTASISYAADSYKIYFYKALVGYDCTAKVAAAKALVSAVQASNYTEKHNTTISGTAYTDQQAAGIYAQQANTALDNVTKDTTFAAVAAEGNKVTSAGSYSIAYQAAIKAILYGYTADVSGGADGSVLTSAATSTQLTNAGTKGFYGNLAALRTVAEQTEIDNYAIADAKHASGEISYWANRTYYPAMKVVAGQDITARATGKALYGVSVANTSKITEAEATAINAALQTNINTTLEVLDVYFNQMTTGYATAVTALENNATNYAAFSTAITNALAAKSMYDKVVAYGDNLKAAVTISGTKQYKDSDVDSAVSAAKKTIYGSYAGGYSTTESTYFSTVAPINDPVAVAIAAATAKFIPHIIYTGDDKTAAENYKYCKDYYSTATSPTNWGSKYDTIKSDTIKALNDAKTIDEVNKIMSDADSKLAALRTAANETTAFQNAVAKYQQALEQYATEQCKLKNSNNTLSVVTYRPASFIDKTDVNTTSALEAGNKLIASSLSANDLDATYAKAKALFDGIKTDADLVKEAAAVQAQIAALPATPTVANEVAFEKAYDAYQAYIGEYGAYPSDIAGAAVFTSKMNTLKAAQAQAVKDAIDAMNKDGVVTEDELAAVTKMDDTYKNYYDQYDESFDLGTTYETALANAKATVRTAQKNAVMQMIAKLTPESSVADLTAAKAAYDALTGSQQREIAEVYPYKVQLLKTGLVSAVEALKLTASSKTYKGKMVIKWKVVGDATGVKYQVFRSLHKNYGYKYMKTTSLKKYVNTKNLKAGKTYYYKVRAYITVDGVKYFSDWSNKAFRTAK